MILELPKDNHNNQLKIIYKTLQITIKKNKLLRRNNNNKTKSRANKTLKKKRRPKIKIIRLK